ncbi:MAG: hypothetical protein K0S66_3268 [Sphingomonas sp.]|jgi:hypothetical protein|nr:hypothetical protein [Sphingomonas sp.]
MLKLKRRRLDHRAGQATRRLVEIERSIASLSDDDLLDLADIFQTEPRGPLGEVAWTEMGRRKLSL